MTQWNWLIALAAFLLTALGVYAGWVARIIKGENASEKADNAYALAQKIEGELAEFREKAAQRFATIEMVEKSESRVVDAINRLADRLDRVLERTAPRTRAPGH